MSYANSNPIKGDKRIHYNGATARQGARNMNSLFGWQIQDQDGFQQHRSRLDNTVKDRQVQLSQALRDRASLVEVNYYIGLVSAETIVENLIDIYVYLKSQSLESMYYHKIEDSVLIAVESFISKFKVEIDNFSSWLKLKNKNSLLTLEHHELMAEVERKLDTITRLLVLVPRDFKGIAEILGYLAPLDTQLDQTNMKILSSTCKPNNYNVHDSMEYTLNDKSFTFVLLLADNIANHHGHNSITKLAILTELVPDMYICEYQQSLFTIAITSSNPKARTIILERLENLTLSASEC